MKEPLPMKETLLKELFLIEEPLPMKEPLLKEPSLLKEPVQQVHRIVQRYQLFRSSPKRRLEHLVKHRLEHVAEVETKRAMRDRPPWMAGPEEPMMVLAHGEVHRCQTQSHPMKNREWQACCLQEAVQIQDR